MLGAHQPIFQDFEESLVTHFRRCVKISRKRSDGFFIDFEKQTIFAAKMLEDGSFGDSESGGDVADASSVVALFGEMAHGGVNNSGSFAFRPGPGRHATITRRRNQAATDSTHM